MRVKHKFTKEDKIFFWFVIRQHMFKSKREFGFSKNKKSGRYEILLSKNYWAAHLGANFNDYKYVHYINAEKLAIEAMLWLAEELNIHVRILNACSARGLVTRLEVRNESDLQKLFEYCMKFLKKKDFLEYKKIFQERLKLIELQYNTHRCKGKCIDKNGRLIGVSIKHELGLKARMSTSPMDYRTYGDFELMSSEDRVDFLKSKGINDWFELDISKCNLTTLTQHLTTHNNNNNNNTDKHAIYIPYHLPYLTASDQSRLLTPNEIIEKVMSMTNESEKHVKQACNMAIQFGPNADPKDPEDIDAIKHIQHVCKDILVSLKNATKCFLKTTWVDAFGNKHQGLDDAPDAYGNLAHCFYTSHEQHEIFHVASQLDEMNIDYLTCHDAIYVLSGDTSIVEKLDVNYNWKIKSST